MTKQQPVAGGQGLGRRMGVLALLGGVSLLGLGMGWAPAASAAPAAINEPSEVGAVIVTARKRSEELSKVPASITAFTSVALQTYNIQTFNDYATKAPNLAFTYGSGPTGISSARTISIRGITGQNLQGTGGATGFYIDDTPVPDSIDPRILDIDNVEVLKGPQGTLYGESSLGGNVRLITKQPNLSKNSATVSAETGYTSQAGMDGDVSAIGNLVVVPDKLAVRAVGFYNYDAGYLTRSYPTDPNSPGTSVGHQGAITSYGGSIAGLLSVSSDLDVKVRLMGQDQFDHGFPTAVSSLEGASGLTFGAPNYTMDRAFNVQPKASDLWLLPSLELEYRGHGFTITSSASYFYRQTQDIEDSTYGTQQALASSFYGATAVPAQPYQWIGKHSHRQFSTETRLSFDPVHNLSGTLGIFYSNTQSNFSIPPIYAKGLAGSPLSPTSTLNAGYGITAWPNNLLWEQQGPGTQEDVSLFGELYYKFLEKFTLTLGGRAYYLDQHADYTADGFLNVGPTLSNPTHNTERGFDPKVEIAYQMTDAAMVYASASEGFRAGGASEIPDFCALPGVPSNAPLKSDSLWSYEGGGKVQLSNPGILLSGAVFHIDWTNPQQQVALPAGCYVQINGKAAAITGGEFEATGHLTDNLTGRLGIGYEDAKITDPGGLAYAGVASGSRIAGTPALTGNVGLSYERPVFDNKIGFGSIDYSYTGDSVSLLVSGYGSEATRPSYSLVNARFGLRWNGQELALNLHNLTNAKPNLGDIGYIGYAEFNSAGVVTPQVATLQPFTVSLQYKKSF